MKKLLKKLSVMRLEERVLFDAAAAAAAAEAEQQAQQNEDLQQQQQQLQEQLAEEAEQQAQQQQQQAEAQPPAGEEPAPGGEEEAEAPVADAPEKGSESVAAGSEVSVAVEAIAADEGIEVEESTDVLENDSDKAIGETVAEVVASDVEAESEELSADIEAAAEAEAEENDDVLMSSEEIAAAIAEGTRHELVIVSDSVPDAKVIIDSLAEGTEVLVLDRNSDVLDQINEYLDASAVKYAAIHIVSHGGDGFFTLSGSMIDMESLEADPASWAAVGEHIAENGDIMLYGCNIAASEDGKAFASQIASLTGADVAASIDSVGGEYGWELEYVTAAVSTPVLSITDYSSSLATYTVVVQTGTNEHGDGIFGRYASTPIKRYSLVNGQLYEQNRANADADWGTATKVEGNVGTWSWVWGQSGVSEINVDAGVTGQTFSMNSTGTGVNDANVSLVSGDRTLDMGANHVELLFDNTKAYLGDITINSKGNVTLNNFDVGDGDWSVTTTTGSITVRNAGGNDSLQIMNGSTLVLNAGDDITFENDLKLELSGNSSVSLTTGDDAGDVLTLTNASLTSKDGADNTLSLDTKSNIAFTSTNLYGNLTVEGADTGNLTFIGISFDEDGTEHEDVEFTVEASGNVTLGDFDLDNGNSITVDSNAAGTMGGEVFITTATGDALEVKNGASLSIEADRHLTFTNGLSLELGASDDVEAVNPEGGTVEFDVGTIGRIDYNGDTAGDGSLSVTAAGGVKSSLTITDRLTERITFSGVTVTREEGEDAPVTELALSLTHADGNSGVFDTDTNDPVTVSENARLSLEHGHWQANDGVTLTNGSLNVGTGASLTVSPADVIVTAPGNYTYTTTNAAFVNNGSLTLSGSSEITGGGYLTVVGSISAQEGADVTISGTKVALQQITITLANPPAPDAGAFVVTDGDDDGTDIGTVNWNVKDGGVFAIAVDSSDDANGLFDNNVLINLDHGTLKYTEFGTAAVTFDQTITAANGSVISVEWDKTDDAAGDNDAKSTTINHLYLTTGTTSLQGGAAFTVLKTEFASGQNAILNVDGKGTEVTLTKHTPDTVDGINIIDNSGSTYTVTGGGTLSVTLTDTTLLGNFSVDGEGTLNLNGTRANLQNTVLGNGENVVINIEGNNFRFENYVGLGRNGGTINIKGTGANAVTFSKDVTNAFGWYASEHYNPVDNSSYTHTSGYTFTGQQESSANNSLQDYNVTMWFDQTATDLEDYRGEGGEGGDVVNGRTRNSYYLGTINVSGVVNFNGQVVSTGTFNINAAAEGDPAATQVTFAKSSGDGNASDKFSFLAVAGGTFTIANDTTVTFGNNVYISAVFNGRDTVFNINGGNVTFSKDVMNWVRSWRGDHDFNPDTDQTKNNNEDMVARDVGGSPGLVVFTRHNVSSTVNFNGGTVNFEAGTYYNYGSFGVTTTNVQANANVTFKNVENVGFAAIVRAAKVGTQPGFLNGAFHWDPRLTEHHPYVSSQTLAADGYINSSANHTINGAVFNIFGNTTISGYLLNAGPSANSDGPGSTTTSTNAGLYIYGEGTGISGALINIQDARFSLADGAKENSFGSIYNNLLPSGYTSADNESITVGNNNRDTVIYLTGQNKFGEVHNKALLTVANTNNAQLSLINYEAGRTTITGTNTNLDFVNVDIVDDGQTISTGIFLKGGQVDIISEFGGNGIAANINIKNGAALNFQANNIVKGDITNAGGFAISSAVDNFKIEGDIINQSTGEFSISGFTDISGTVINSGVFTSGVAGMVFDESFTNNNILNVNKVAAFTALTNNANGSISFGGTAGTSIGAEYSVFRNLVNYGTVEVSISSVLFADSLQNNAGGKFIITEKGSGTRFKNMLGSDGTIRFVNSGTFEIKSDSAEGEYIDVRNYGGSIVVNSNVNFGKVVNENRTDGVDTPIVGKITVNSPKTLDFYGSVRNDGTIGGSGNVNFHYAVAGSGKFDFISTSEIVYNFDNTDEGGFDANGYYRIGGELVYYINDNEEIQLIDKYSNRPEFDSELGVWLIGGTTVSHRGAEFDAYVKDGNWYIGGDNTNVAVTEYAADYYAFSKADGNADNNIQGHWQVTIDGAAEAEDLFRIERGINTTAAPIDADVRQSLFGGTVGTLTIGGDAVLNDVNTDASLRYIKGVALGEDLELTVLTELDNTGTAADPNDGIRLMLNADSKLTLKGEGYADDSHSSIRMIAGSTLNVERAATAGTLTVQTIQGEVINEGGTIRVSERQGLTFNGQTSGSGFVAADDDTTVTYSAIDLDGVTGEDNRHIFAGAQYADDNAFHYDNLVISSAATLNGNATVNVFNNGGETDHTLTVENGKFTLRERTVGDNSRFIFGRHASGDFQSNDKKTYTIDSVTLNSDAYGVKFSAPAEGSRITVNTLDNNLGADSDENFMNNYYSGVTADGYVTFTTVTNNGVFNVNSKNVTLGTFTNFTADTTGGLTAGTLNINVGNGTAYTLSTGINNHAGAVINLQSGNITISSGTYAGMVNVGQAGTEAAAVTLNLDGTAAPLNLALVTVNANSILNTTGTVNLGSADVENGLTLEGKLFVSGSTGETTSIYGFTRVAVSDGVTDITVQDGATLTLVNGVGTYGLVTADIEAIGGTVNEHDRMNGDEAGSLSEWIVIYGGNALSGSVNVSTLTQWNDSNYGNTYKFLIRDDYELVFDATKEGAEFYFRLDGDTDGDDDVAQLTFNASADVAGTTLIGSGAILQINDGAAVNFNGSFTADGSIDINGTGSAAFNSSIAGTAAVAADADSNVIYAVTGENRNVYAGTYGTLTINASDVVIGNITIATALTTTRTDSSAISSAIVTGNITTGEGNAAAKVKAGTTTSVVDGTTQYHQLSVSYTGGRDQKILGTGTDDHDAYWNLRFEGLHDVDSNITVANDLIIGDDAALNAGIFLDEDVTLKLNHAVDDTEGDKRIAHITGADNSRVIYNYTGEFSNDLTMFRGKYFDVQLLGRDGEGNVSTYTVSDFTLLQNGVISGNAKLKVDYLSESSQGRVDSYTDDESGTTYYMTVTYGENSLNVLAGDYQDLYIYHQGPVQVLTSSRLNGSALETVHVTVHGTLTNDANLITAAEAGAQFTISGASYGNGTFGNGDTAYAGKVIYNLDSGSSAQDIMRGSYSDLEFSGSTKQIVGDVSVSGTLRTTSGVRFDSTDTDRFTFETNTLDMTDTADGKFILVDSGHTFKFGANSTITELRNEGFVEITDGTYAINSLDGLKNEGTVTIGTNADVTFSNETFDTDSEDGNVVVNGILRFSGNGYTKAVDLTVNSGGTIYLEGATVSVANLEGLGDVVLAQSGTGTSAVNSLLKFIGIGRTPGDESYNYPEKFSDVANYNGQKPDYYFGGTLTIQDSTGAQSNQLLVRGDFEIQNLILKGNANVTVGDITENNVYQGAYLVLNYVNYPQETFRNERSYSIVAQNYSTIFFKNQYQGDTPVTQKLLGSMEEKKGSHIVYDSNFFTMTVAGYWVEVTKEFLKNFDGALDPDKGYHIHSGVEMQLSLAYGNDSTADDYQTIFSEFWVEEGATLTINAANAANNEFTLGDIVTNLGTIKIAEGMTLHFSTVYDSNILTTGVDDGNAGIVKAANATVSFLGGSDADNSKTVFGGEYGTLTLNGFVTSDADITVGTLTLVDQDTTDTDEPVATFNGSTTVKTTLEGTGTLRFNGVTAGEGASSANTLDVIYGPGSGTHMFAGTFGTVTLNASKETVSGKTYTFDALVNNAVLSGGGDVTTTAIDGTGSVNFSGGSFTLHGDNDTLQSGTYYDLVVNGYNTQVGDVVISNTLTGASYGSINFTGTTGGAARVTGGTLDATYGTKAGTIFGGDYDDLTIKGSRGGEGENTGSVDVNLNVDGTLTLNGQLTTSEERTWSFKKVAADTGSNLRDLTLNNANGTVSFGDGNVIAGTYGTLNVTPATDDTITIYGNVKVNNNANFGDKDAVISADANAQSAEVFFAAGAKVAETNDATFGTASARYGHKVTYNGVDNVLGGYYEKIVLNGENSVRKDVTVSAEDAKISSVTTGTGDSAVITPGKLTVAGAVNFNNKTDAEGNASTVVAAVSGGVKSGSVTYGANAAVYGGDYNDLTIISAHSLTNSFGVAGKAEFTGAQTVAEGVTVTLSGATNANDGSATMAGKLGSTVIYNGTDSNNNVYAGTYGDLIITGDRTLTNSFDVAGNADISGTQTIGANGLVINFNGTTSNTGSNPGRFERELEGGAKTKSTISYKGGENVTVFGGTYYNLTIKDSSMLNVSFDVDGTASINGTQTLNEKVVVKFNYQTDANVSGNNGFITGAANSSVEYAKDAAVYGTGSGSYGDLTISGNHTLANDFTVAGKANFSGVQILEGEVKITLAGNNSGEGTFADGVEPGTQTHSTVTYTETASGVFGTSVVTDAGVTTAEGYGNLVIRSSQTLAKDFLVKASATLSGTQTLSEDVEVTFSGLTNANESVSTGGTDAAAAVPLISGQTGSQVKYNGKEGNNVYGGTYSGLTIEGAHTLANDFTVAGSAQISGAQNVAEGVSVIFNGFTDANAEGNSGTIAGAAGSSVTYNGSNANVYGTGSGSYGDLTITGNHTLAKDFTVAGTADISDVQTLKGAVKLTFAGTNNGKGTFADEVEQGAQTYYSTVTYTETAVGVYGTVSNSSYGNLTIESAQTLNKSFAVAGTATLSGEMSGTANVTFNGATANSSDPDVAAGSFNMTGGTVTYAPSNSQTQVVYGGAYNGLTITGNHALDNDFTVAGSAALNGQLTGTAAVTFNGTTSTTLDGDQVFGDGGTTPTTPYGGAVTYGSNAAVMGGLYTDLTVTGDHTYNYSFSVAGAAALSGVQTLAQDVSVSFNGTTNAGGSTGTGTGSNAAAAATFDGSKGSVSYGAKADVYGGTYGNLTITEDHALGNDFTVNGNSHITGIMSGKANVTFGSSSALAKGSTGTFGSKDAAYEGLVTYKGGSGSAASGAGVYSGAYTDLTLDGNLTMTNKTISVEGVATVNGEQTLTGSTKITFAGTTEGKGSIKGDASSNVTYKENADVFNGTYYDLIIEGSKEVAGDLTVSNMLTLTDGSELSGSGDWKFALTNATKDSTATISNTGTVTYDPPDLASGTQWIYGGEYKDLVVKGSYSVGDISVSGTVSTEGNNTLTFEGSVSGGSFIGTTIGSTTHYLSAVYNAGGNIMQGTYKDLSVKGTGSVTGETVVKGYLEALPSTTAGGAISAGSTSYALITGSGTLKIEGALKDFTTDGASKGRFAHTGEVILAGTSGTSYTINGGNLKNSFNTLTVEKGITLNLANSTVTGTFESGSSSNTTVSDTAFTTIKGKGNITIHEGVTGSSINMEEGIVTYEKDAPATLIYGTYNNLTLKQSEPGTETIKIGGSLTVKKLFDIGNHKLDNSGNLTIYTFTKEADLTNSGTLTFGSNDGTVSSPDANDPNKDWVGGVITNKGSMTVNRGNYTFGEVINDRDGKGSITVTKEAKNNLVTFTKLVNPFGSSVTLNSKTQISEMDKVNGGWINEGDLTIDGFSNFGFDAGTRLELTLANRSSLTINNGGVFKLGDDGESFVTEGYTFGGNITLNNGGSVKIGTGTEALFFDVNEIVGTKSYETVGDGTIIFGFGDTTAVYQQGLYGDLKNNGNMYFLSTGMKYLGNVTNGSASADTDGNMFIYADSTFKGTVNSEYGWVIVGDGTDAANATFVNTVHSGSAFLINSGSHATFESTLTTAHQFTVADGGSALFKGDVTVSASANNEADTVFTVKNGATAEFLGNLTNTNSGTAWHSVLQIDGTVAVNGTLTNTAGSTASNVANVIITSDGNTFGAITNTGAAAKFELNSSNNQFNGLTTNSGQLYLNGVNTFNAINNTGAGYLWINDGASGSIFQGNITNSGTMTVASNTANGVIKLTFNGNLTNSNIVNLNAGGYTFNGTVTNSKTFNVYAKGIFDGELVNSGIFNVAAEGVSFNKVTNSGTFAVNAATGFTGLFTNSGTLNINVSNQLFPEVSNSGTINLHGAEQTVFENLSQKGGTIDIDKDSTLHLHVVADDKASSIIVRGEREGVYEKHTEPNVSGSGHGLYFESVTTLKEPQVINANITYEGEIIEDSVWYDSKYTYLVGEESTWIVVDSAMTIENFSEKGKYRVVAGGVLTVIGTASGSRFQVTGNGILNFSNTHELTVNGLIEVKSKDAVLTVNGTDNTFNGAVDNIGTANFKSKNISFNGGFTNSGTINAYVNVKGEITNDGIYNAAANGIVIGGAGTQLTNSDTGIVNVAAGTRLEKADLGGAIAIQKGATLTAAVTSITSDITNNGTVAISNSSNYLEISGDVQKGSGTFTGSDPVKLVFSGNVATGTSAVFNSNIVNVEYSGASAKGQNIILGTYNNLTLAAGTAFKIVDDGTVTVNGDFTNGSGVQITDDGQLILNKAVAGDGSYDNAGILTFGKNSSGTAAKIINKGTVNADSAITVSELQNNAGGEFNANGNGVTVSGGNNQGKLDVTGDKVDVSVNNGPAGQITVSGEEAELDGTNSGSISVATDGSAATSMDDQKGASYDVAEGGKLSLGANNDNGTADYNAKINNKGTLSVDADVNSFAGGVENDGTISVTSHISDEEAMEALLKGNEEGVIDLEKSIVDDDESMLQNQKIKGEVNVNYTLTDEALKGTTITEDSTLGINADSTISAAPADNEGTVRVAEGVTLTVTPADDTAEFNGNYDVDGNLDVAGDATFNGDVDNSGDVSVEGNATFNGDVDNSGELGIGGDAAFNGDVDNSGTISVDGTSSFDNAVDNSGHMGIGGDAAFSGPVDNSGTISVDGTSTFDNAVDNSGDINADDAAFNGPVDNSGAIGAENVTFSGATSGSGSVNAQNASYEGNATGIFSGEYGNLSISTNAKMLGDASTDTMSLYGALTTHEDGVLSISGERFSAESFEASGSGSWSVFSAAGGVGDAYPSFNNPNFHALARYVKDLEIDWSNTGRFDMFRRMPTSKQPIAVGDMSDHIVLNNFEGYDMIDFDSEFFGHDGIGLLDEEAREVLEDAASAGASDLKALLED